MDNSKRRERERLASITWGIAPISRVDEFFQHLRTLVGDAVRQGATIVLLPELFETELLKTMPDGPTNQVAEKLVPFAQVIDDELSALARTHKVTVVGGSYLRQGQEGVVNVATIATPTGDLHFQPKNCRTQWEISPWGLQQRLGLRKFPDSRLGVLVCYDSEFPEATRALAEAGTQLLCVPSYTESQHGYQRVNWSCRARAIENEIFVAQACVVGEIECFGLGTGYGQSSIIAPSKDPFPASAILAESPLNQEGIAVADVDFMALAECRATGDARPWSDRHLAPWTFEDSQQ
jgi:predicted amidohydrolase